MPEILTESFCERCGTRYTFESAAPRAPRLTGIKVLSRGLKNFVMSDDTSMDEAMAAARSETDREVTTQQLDAFHKTFNFCMTCRQYTCGNCWNEAEGRCLTCAPHLGHEILQAPFPDLPADGEVAAAAIATNGANGHAPEPVDALAWPTMDLERDLEPQAEVVEDEPVEEIDAVARLAALGALDAAIDDEGDHADAPTWTAAAPEGLARPDVEAGRIDDATTNTEDPIDVAPLEVAATEIGEAEPIEAEPATADTQAAAAATQTNDLMRRFRPGQSLDAEIDAYEREQADPEAAAALAAATAPSAVEVPVEPEPVQPAALAEPVAAAPDAAEPAPAAPPRDVVEQPTWRIVAPDPETTPSADPTPRQPGVLPPAVAGEPQWPSAPEWPSQRPAQGLPFLDRPAQPTGGMEALWAESSREVASPVAQGGATPRSATGVEPCVSCGLSLSATARFCRRCGTRQG
jgi:hypothetical protein